MAVTRRRGNWFFTAAADKVVGRNKVVQSPVQVFGLVLEGSDMKLKVIIHPAEEGGYWGEVPAIQGCATQGETMEKLLTNLYEAIKACLSVDLENIEIAENDRIFELAV